MHYNLSIHLQYVGMLMSACAGEWRVELDKWTDPHACVHICVKTHSKQNTQDLYGRRPHHALKRSRHVE